MVDLSMRVAPAIEARQVVIAERAGQVVGMALFRADGRFTILDRLYVLPSEQGRGVGPRWSATCVTTRWAMESGSRCSPTTTPHVGSTRAKVPHLGAHAGRTGRAGPADDADGLVLCRL